MNCSVLCAFPRRRSDHPDSIAKRLLRALIASGLMPGSLLRRSLAGQDLLLYRKLELGPYATSRKSLSVTWCRPYGRLPAGTYSGGVAAPGARLWWSHGQRQPDARGTCGPTSAKNCLVKTDRASMLHSLEVACRCCQTPFSTACSRFPRMSISMTPAERFCCVGWRNNTCGTGVESSQARILRSAANVFQRTVARCRR